VYTELLKHKHGRNQSPAKSATGAWEAIRNEELQAIQGDAGSTENAQPHSAR